ncbi:putative nuclear membrane fusion protein kar5 protein [Erysiphe necator]|uniref:Putative nuclear membrane fusion protein kar5 protein n=1 Tax=Uncinula necator TaxID=52586 RepID=A0A0B1PGM3_UNCNE|nr:putative nuclear membrane fusion protein kar5 protein [Erysiphe necator]
MAAYLLMNNCKGLNEIDEQNYSINRGRIQQDQVDAFAATLTMCDMERAKFDVPKPCFHFTSISLMKTAELKKDLKFSSQEVNDCLQGLGKNAKHWATWLSYRDSALLFCRAARLSIERDETIALHRELMVIMKDFTRDLHLDLQNLKDKVSLHKDLIDSIFKKMNIDATDWRFKLNKIFGDVSQNINVHLTI